MLDDDVEIGITAGPAQHVASPSRIGNERRRVSRAARRLHRRHGLSRRAAHSRDHFPYRLAVAGPEIHSLAGRSLVQPLQRAKVRVGQVHDVDVVADRGAVGVS